MSELNIRTFSIKNSVVSIEITPTENSWSFEYWVSMKVGDKIVVIGSLAYAQPAQPKQTIDTAFDEAIAAYSRTWCAIFSSYFGEFTTLPAKHKRRAIGLAHLLEHRKSGTLPRTTTQTFLEYSLLKIFGDTTPIDTLTKLDKVPRSTIDRRVSRSKYDY